jgi:GxxExxY protein
MEVHGVLGSAFLELVYQEAIAIELARRRITTAREVILPIHYKGVTLRTGYRVDFICFGSVLVELKAIEGLTPRDESQMINYLVASRLGKGLLLNFGSPQLQFRRFVAGADPGAGMQYLRHLRNLWARPT